MLFPTAIGRRPPVFLDSANRLAPKKNGRIHAGARPANTVFVKSVKAWSNRVHASPLLGAIKSLRTCSLRRSGPPVDPAGTERLQLPTLLSGRLLSLTA